MEFSAKDGVSSTIRKIRKGTVGLSDDAKRAGVSMNRIGTATKGIKTSILDLRSGWLGVTAAVGGTVLAVQALVRHAREGAEAIDVASRVDGIAGARERVEALTRGLRNTLDTTSIERTALLFERVNLSAQQLETVGQFVVSEAARSGRDTNQILETLAGSFASERWTGLKRIGISARNGAEALQQMAQVAQEAATTLDKSLRVKMDQAVTKWDNKVSDLQASLARFALGSLDALDQGEKAILAGIGAITGREQAIKRLQDGEKEWVVRLEAEREKLVSIEHGLLGVTENGAARLRQVRGQLYLHDSHITKLGDLAEREDKVRESLENANVIWAEYYRRELDAIAGAREMLQVSNALAATMRGAVTSSIHAASGALGGFLQKMAQAGVRGAVANRNKGKGSGKGAKKKTPDQIAQEYLDARFAGADQHLSGFRSASADILLSSLRASVPNPDEPFDAVAMLAQRRQGHLDANRDQNRAPEDPLAELQRKREELLNRWVSTSDQFASAQSQMWQALSDAGASKKALAVVRGFAVAHQAIMAVDSGIQSVREFALGLGAAASYRYGEAALHFASSATHATVAAGKVAGAVNTARGIGSYGSSGGTGSPGNPGYSAPNYSSGRTESGPTTININLNGPAIDSPEFRQTVTDAVRQGTREGQSTDPYGSL